MKDRLPNCDTELLSSSSPIHLRCIETTRFGDAESSETQALLNPAEFEHMQCLRTTEDRRDYAAAHALLRRMLSAAMPAIRPKEWRFCRTARGKLALSPELADFGPLAFSISHARGMVACAVSMGAKIGVDVALDTPTIDVEALARVACSGAELAQLESLPASLRAGYFLDLWALKEAYLKACGAGITEGLPETGFDLREPARVVALLPPDVVRQWGFALLVPLPGSRVALAAAPLSPQGVQWDALLNAELIGPTGVFTPLKPRRTGIGVTAEGHVPGCG